VHIDDQTLVLQSESDVEQKVIMPLLTGEAYLDIPQAMVFTKAYMAPTALDKDAGKKTGYFPDYTVWVFGFPVMVVEAKAPEVPAEVGYREASLYARHLNQQYRTGLNPCRSVLATNGKTVLFGYWDAPPELTLELSQIRIGTSGLEALQSRCAAAVLDEYARSCLHQVHAEHVSYPIDYIGGPPVLNSKLPLNSFAAELSPILRRYFSSGSQENVREIAERAYVSSAEVTEYDRVLESLLKERLSLRRGSVVKTLEPGRYGEDNVARAISTFDKERPPRGQLQIIQGSVGAGKSLFIRRYKEMLQPDTDAKRTRWAFIDFNTGPPDLSNAQPWLCSAFVESFREENPELDLSSPEALRGMFSRNLQKRRPIYDELAAASPEQAAGIKAQDLISWQDNPSELARGLAEYVLGSRHELLVVVMDNVDRLDLNGQLQAFQLSLYFMELTRCFITLQMRDETYERFKDKPPLDTFRAGITFHISPPRFIDVVKRRLELSLEYLANEAQEVQRYTLESGLRISYPKTELGTFLREIYTELFERRHNISRVLEALAGRDVRRALEMFVSVITSGHLSETAITSNVMGARAFPIREHDVLKILMRTDYRFASENSGYIINIFHFEPEWQRPDNFILIEILYFLTANRKKKGEIGLEGYFSCRHVADELQRYGYVPEDTLGGLNYLLRKQLIAADHLNFSNVRFEDSVRILASGFMHVRVLSERLEYLYGVIPTTPFFYAPVAKHLSGIVERENRNGKVTAPNKLMLLRYYMNI
jgi:hypothetical protein